MNRRLVYYFFIYCRLICHLIVISFPEDGASLKQKNLVEILCLHEIQKLNISVVNSIGVNAE